MDREVCGISSAGKDKELSGKPCADYPRIYRQIEILCRTSQGISVCGKPMQAKTEACGRQSTSREMGKLAWK